MASGSVASNATYVGIYRNDSDEDTVAVNLHRNVYPVSWNVRVFESVLALTVSLLIVTTNIIAIAVYMRVSELKVVTSCSLHVSLAVADLFVGLQGFLYVQPPLLGYWPYPKQVCQFSAYLAACSVHISMWSLGSLSYDRYSAICHPYRHNTHITKTRCKIAVATIWFFSFILNSLFLVLPLPAFTFSPATNLCTVNVFEKRLLPFIAMRVAFVALPNNILIVSCYRKIFKVARGMQVQPTPAAAASDHVQTPQQHNWKALRTVVVVVGCFFGCQLPIIISVPFQSDIARDAPLLILILYWLLISNSFMNCFIYIATNRRFRKGFRDMIRLRSFAEHF